MIANAVLHMDPSKTVDLTDRVAVRNAIERIMELRGDWTLYYRGLLAQAIDDLAAAFAGDYPGFLRCDTWYHDLRHALDSALAMARLLEGYRKAGAQPAIDTETATIGLVLALFHDIGLLRHESENHLQGAVLTPVHERRSVAFVRNWMAKTPLAHRIDLAAIIMITRLTDPVPASLTPQQRALASLLGSADLMAQLADRCYLEKSRDFLFIELSAAGLAGVPGTRYPTPETLLQKTPIFARFFRRRMDESYEQADRYMRVYFDGVCPYAESIERNFAYLEDLLATDNLEEGLRRLPQRLVGA